jgi:acyl-CoA dehydrogenase
MISFELSEEQRQVRDMLSAFAAHELVPCAREADERRAAPANVLDAAWSLGLIGVPIGNLIRLAREAESRNASVL